MAWAPSIPATSDHESGITPEHAIIRASDKMNQSSENLFTKSKGSVPEKGGIGMMKLYNVDDAFTKALRRLALSIIV